MRSSSFKLITRYFLAFFAGASLTLGVICFRYGDLLKYDRINQVMTEMSKRKYDQDTYNCVNFSQDAVQKLKDLGVSSNTIVVHKPDATNNHAVVALWIDPQNGNFVNGMDYIGDYAALKNEYGWKDR